jgi:hypothetical protein
VPFVELSSPFSTLYNSIQFFPQDETNSNADEHDEIIPEKICL